MTEELYLGVDGGQSHTEAVVADRAGRVLGRGRGGPSNHAEQPGGPKRLRRAVVDSVGSALRAARLRSLGSTEFVAAHLAMTGGADNKEEIIAHIVRAGRLAVDHDAPAALAGATAAEPGIVIIAGTGSVAYGEKASGERLRLGGWGHLFGDEGSGFWIALQAARRAMLARDGLAAPTTLTEMLLEYFDSTDLMTFSRAVYHHKITRDRFATFATHVHRAAQNGDQVAREIIEEGARSLAALSASVARRLQFAPEELRVACVGGVFRGELMCEAFDRALGEQLPDAQIITPRFDPAIGALLLAYRAAGVERTQELLMNLGQHCAGAHTHAPGTPEE
jgi:N-acetylglucosamine kinase-like BadF-type ATPase